MGTHSRLMADREGLYRRLCARQIGEPAMPIIPRRPTNPGARPRSVASIEGAG